jgi:hypothetical protein
VSEQKLLSVRREGAAREAALEAAAAAASAEAEAAEQLVAALQPKGDSVLSTLWNEVRQPAQAWRYCLVQQKTLPAKILRDPMCALRLVVMLQADVVMSYEHVWVFWVRSCPSIFLYGVAENV